VHQRWRRFACSSRRAIRSVEDAGHRALVAGREQLEVVALPCSSTTERRLQATKEYDLIRLPEEG